MKRVIKAAYTPTTPEEIIEYYQLTDEYEIKVICVYTNYGDFERISSQIQELQNLGYIDSGIEIIQYPSQNKQVEEYVYDYVDSYDNVEPGYEIPIPQPEWMFVISNVDSYDWPDPMEFTFETTTSYFDNSFGNYLPDTQEYTTNLDTCIDFDYPVTVDEFENNIYKAIMDQRK